MQPLPPQTSRTETEQKLDRLVHGLREELELLIGACKTTEDLKVVLAAASQANTFLARAVAVAISSFADGGAAPAKGKAYKVHVKASADLERIEEADVRNFGEGLAGPLRHLLYLQHATGRAAAEAHTAVMQAGAVSMTTLGGEAS